MVCSTETSDSGKKTKTKSFFSTTAKNTGSTSVLLLNRENSCIHFRQVHLGLLHEHTCRTEAGLNDAMMADGGMQNGLQPGVLEANEQ
jgi:hypothetical protein